MRIQRLQTRIIVLFVALLALVQVAAFWFVNAANSRNAQAKVAEELNVGQRVFARLLDQNAEKLKLSARVLAADFGFREAIATHDTGTIASALANHGARIGAEAMVFVDLEGQVVSDTLSPRGASRAFEYPALLKTDTKSASASMEVLDGRAFQLVAVPVMAPLPIGWVVMGFAVDDALASDLRQLTELEVSFMLDGKPERRVLASTLALREQVSLLANMPSRSNSATRLVMKIGGVDHQALVIPLDENAQSRIVAVLHRSLGDAMATFERLRNTLFILAALSLTMSILGSIAVARNITRPLEALATVAARIEKGDYTAPVNLKRADEIGVLASSLNHMRGSIADREKRILKLAYEDPLTDLANRSRFSNELEHAISQAALGNLRLTILMMDLDRFKYVNDTLGHGVGDHVLREVSARLKRTVKGAECIARLGGDEFAILLRHADDDFSEIARQIIAVLEAPIFYEGQPLDVGTSIGIAHFPEHGRDAQTLVRNADIAMYAAKRNKTGFATYERDYDTTQQEHLSLLSELRRAVDRNELRLHYQPKVSLHSSHVSAVEALIRWEHPTRGLVPPAQFIPFATHTGYIKLLTRWVIREAVRQCGEWLRSGLVLQVSSEHLGARSHESRLPDLVAELLAEHDVTPGLLCLEITESGFNGGSRARSEGARPARRARRQTLHRRLRHRLLVAVLHHEAARAGAEDRSVVHLAHGDGRRDLDHRAFDPSISDTTSDCRCRRRRRGRGRSGTCCAHSAATTRQGFFMSRPLEPAGARKMDSRFLGPGGDSQLRRSRGVRTESPKELEVRAVEIVADTPGAKLRRCSGLGPSAFNAAT
jgi:diguanylate cyclase (GGDEF)-like protein